MGGDTQRLKDQAEKVKRLDEEINREKSMDHYTATNEDLEMKVRNLEQLLQGKEANLNKQLERETEKGAQILTLKYEIKLW